MNPTKQRQYAHLAQQLKLLNQNLEKTTEELNIMSSQCNKNIVGQIGKIHSSWFIASNRYFEKEMLGEGR
ncbi:Hsk3p NDAI_0E01970 [Naumovozyma dairenensis CBS 421]|uniref:DASH complex subunit HSK3 n=1 Tax=Naumovozyma dairenensis (strain ATCC 10597 / BCRC 20456 / CBS 421 / NBRC 0211 / NRRL Y-12639) TaxID=1071378 RepID=G0WB93_NAUDC|nr:hypothetical protein NDAI_0E01970 [Naumovozyma dairenensis CBS 421]CCD25013.1 hypothetical protein NDAI_0E01970 [Naumovozyma dairenensis CBS 421]